MARARQLPPQAKELLQSSPSAIVALDLQALACFVQWTTHAMLPEDIELVLLIKQLEIEQRVGATYMNIASWPVERIEEFLNWVEHESERYALPDEAMLIVNTFSLYCDQEYAWQRRIHEYWLQ